MYPTLRAYTVWLHKQRRTPPSCTCGDVSLGHSPDCARLLWDEDMWIEFKEELLGDDESGRDNVKAYE